MALNLRNFLAPETRHTSRIVLKGGMKLSQASVLLLLFHITILIDVVYEFHSPLVVLYFAF